MEREMKTSSQLSCPSAFESAVIFVRRNCCLDRLATMEFPQSFPNVLVAALLVVASACAAVQAQVICGPDDMGCVCESLGSYSESGP